MALPGSRSIGFAMNVAYTPCRVAASRTVRLNRNAWSASSSGSPCDRLISSCATPASWLRVPSSISWASQKS